MKHRKGATMTKIARTPRLKVFARETLRKERLRQGYTLATFCKAVYYSESAFSKIEKRINGLSPKGTVRVCEVLGMEFDDLFEFINGDENE
jgi:transcriptional regulator with XRE-family HTH domain